jgi:hypothetical protein
MPRGAGQLRIWDMNLSERVVLKGHGKDVCRCARQVMDETRWYVSHGDIYRTVIYITR